MSELNHASCRNSITPTIPKRAGGEDGYEVLCRTEPYCMVDSFWTLSLLASTVLRVLLFRVNRLIGRDDRANKRGSFNLARWRLLRMKRLIRFWKVDAFPAVVAKVIEL